MNVPEYHSHEEFAQRNKTLAHLQEVGIDPYPASFSPKATIQELLIQYANAPVGHSEEALEKKTPSTVIAGRLILFRPMGKNAFGHIQDHSGKLQVMFNRDATLLEGYTPPQETPEMGALKFLEKRLDLGDIVGLEGNLFRTQKGELTLFVHKITFLCKSLLPLADKHSGLADKELRYRKRWLDLITNEEVRALFATRSRILLLLRQFLQEKGFIEVETPVLQGTYGGAQARPFTTTLHALEQEMFLRISLEIPLKKLIIGGFDKVFEIGKAFRNEGIDRSHNPEFTMMEAYASYWDYQDMMVMTETLFEFLAQALHGKTVLSVYCPTQADWVDVDFKAPWKRLTMHEAIATYGAIDVDTLTDDQIRHLLKESGHVDLKTLHQLPRGLLIAALFEVKAEPHLIQPHHIIDHPIETTPLCKPHRDPLKRAAGLVERFESFVACQEICNAYSELNDPQLQRALLEKQAQEKAAGNEEANPLDEEFIEAICQGMPPTGGLGIGIDRLVMLMTASHSIRDVLFFPWMKDKD